MHLLFRHRPLVHGPVKSANDRLPDLAQVVNSLGRVDEDVRSRSLRAECPDLAGLADVPFVRVRQVTRARLRLTVARTNKTEHNESQQILQASVTSYKLKKKQLRRSCRQIS